MTYPRIFTLLPLLCALAACASVPAPSVPRTAILSLGQAARVGSLGVRPLAVTEDSRFPANAQCVWAGRLRLRVIVDDPAAMGRSGGPQAPTTAVAEETDLDLGLSRIVLGRQMTLVEAMPSPMAGQPVSPSAYRFTLRVEERP